MPKKRSFRVTTRKKKKSWWSIFFVLAIATVIGLPISYNMTKSSSQVASTGTSKIAAAISSVNNLTMFRASCPVGSGTFASVQFVCNDNYKSAFIPDSCLYVTKLVEYAEKICAIQNVTAIYTPTPAPSVTTYPTRTPTPTPSINYSVTPTTSGVICSGASPSGKILICFISTCASKGLKTYAPANSYCTGLGKTNCCEW